MNDERITAYLLQELSEEEAERFEEECFAHEEWPADLDSVEQELIDAYLGNELTKERHRRFEEKYLITDARKARVLTAQSFLRILCPPSWKSIFKEKLKALWQRPLVPQTAVAVLILAVMAPVIYRWTSAKTYSPLHLAMTSPDRGGGPQMEKVTLPLTTDGLKIYLDLPEPPQADTTYRVEWENGSGTLGKLPLYSQENQSVVVIIPANQLAPGRYVLKLLKTKRGEAEERVGSYFLNAEERRRDSDTNRQQ